MRSSDDKNGGALLQVKHSFWGASVPFTPSSFFLGMPRERFIYKRHPKLNACMRQPLPASRKRQRNELDFFVGVRSFVFNREIHFFSAILQSSVSSVLKVSSSSSLLCDVCAQEGGRGRSMNLDSSTGNTHDLRQGTREEQATFLFLPEFSPYVLYGKRRRRRPRVRYFRCSAFPSPPLPFLLPP